MHVVASDFDFALDGKHLPVPDDIEPVLYRRDGALQGCRDHGARDISISHFHELSLLVGRPTSSASAFTRTKRIKFGHYRCASGSANRTASFTA
jgi:hypothetical protein